MIFQFSFSQEDEECIFDQSTQTDEFIKDIKEFSNYSWDNNKKEATIILENGDVLIAFRGGCVHFGISGTLIEKNSKEPMDNLEYWFKKSKWISTRLFSESDRKILEKSISEKTYVINEYENFIEIIIPQESYSIFEIYIKKGNDSIELYVGYYF